MWVPTSLQHYRHGQEIRSANLLVKNTILLICISWLLQGLTIFSFVYNHLEVASFAFVHFANEMFLQLIFEFLFPMSYNSFMCSTDLTARYHVGS